MSSWSSRFLALVLVVALLPAVSGAEAALQSGSSPSGSSIPTPETAPAEQNQTVREWAHAAGESALGGVLAGKQINVHVAADGSSSTWGVTVDRDGTVAVSRDAFDDPAIAVRTSETSLRSIVNSEDTGAALERAVSHGLVNIEAAGPATDIGTRFLGVTDRYRVTSADIDLDDDGQTDAVIEVVAQDDGDEPGFDSLVRTVLRDTNGDGEMDTVASETRPLTASVVGGANVDRPNGEANQTLLRVRGEDTDDDGRLDRRMTALFADTSGNEQFDIFSETTAPVQPTRTVTGEWDLNGDGVVSVRVIVEGNDTDGDRLFDEKRTAVFLNLDGEPGFESRTETTASAVAILRVSATFDANSDGDPDTGATLSASDTNDDGALDAEEINVVNDSDGDGTYDRVLRHERFERGFFTNTGDTVEYLSDPGALTLIGVAASILSMLLQLLQGG